MHLEGDSEYIPLYTEDRLVEGGRNNTVVEQLKKLCTTLHQDVFPRVDTLWQVVKGVRISNSPPNPHFLSIWKLHLLTPCHMISCCQGERVWREMGCWDSIIPIVNWSLKWQSCMLYVSKRSLKLKTFFFSFLFRKVAHN